jgi:Tfp pilus assembly protein PilZ
MSRTAAISALAPREQGEDPTERVRRLDHKVPVYLATDDGPLLGATTNLSIGGAFVAAPRCLAIGDRVTARLAILDEFDALELEVEVRWCRPDSDGERRPAGMGLRFIDPDERAAVLVRLLFRSRSRSQRRT